jgi:hypothetical protein
MIAQMPQTIAPTNERGSGRIPPEPIDFNKPVGFRSIPAGNLEPCDRILVDGTLYRYCSWEPGFLRCRTIDTNQPIRIPHQRGARVEVGVYSVGELLTA